MYLSQGRTQNLYFYELEKKIGYIVDAPGYGKQLKYINF